jgi:sugar/nucleoside kinase (ribokinase family)
MKPGFILAGKLQRNTILPPKGSPVIDIPGGDLLYAAAGFLVWEKNIGLLARVGENYPQEWLELFSRAGMDTTGIKILPESIDQRYFLAYDEHYEPINSNPISLFVNRGIPFPKFLSGYQSPISNRKDQDTLDPTSPRPGDIPPAYSKSNHAHLCELEFSTVTRFVSTFREKGTAFLSIDPAEEWMQPENWVGIRLLLNGLSAFLPSRESMLSLFRKKTKNLLEMAEAITNENCGIVAIKCGAQGQLIQDGRSHKSWQVPAYPVNIVDPTGTGAAFCGGFMAGLAQSGDPLQATLMGSVSASISLEGSGIFHILQIQPGLAQARFTSLMEEVREL